MDSSFVRGSDRSTKDNDGKLVTKYIWIYLTRTEISPLEQVKRLLCRFDKYKFATIMTLHGGELA